MGWGRLPAQVEAPDRQGKGGEGGDLDGGAGVGTGDQVIEKDRRGVEQEQQPGQAHIPGPQGHGGQHHGQTQQQAVGPVPGQQGGGPVADQEEDQPQGAAGPRPVIEGADHRPG